MSHWSSGPPVCFPSWGRDPASIPGEYLCETGILLLALSRYIGDPDVIVHCGLIWGGLHPKPSLGPRADNVIIPLDLTQLFCPGFTLAAGPPPASQPTQSAAGGGGPAESLQSHCIHTMSHWSSGLPICSIMRDPSSITGRVLMWNRDFPVGVVLLQYLLLQNICYCISFFYVYITVSCRPILM